MSDLDSIGLFSFITEDDDIYILEGGCEERAVAGLDKSKDKNDIFNYFCFFCFQIIVRDT